MTATTETTTDRLEYTELTAFQRDVMLAIAALEDAEETCYGLGIKQWLEQEHGQEVNHGRLYPNLDKLRDYGLIEQGQVDKRTNRYALTDRGRTLLQTRQRRLENIVR